MRVKNYMEGTRAEIIRLLILNGVITQRGLALIMEGKYNYRTMQRMIHEMTDEGIVCKERIISDHRTTYVYRLSDKLEDYIEELPHNISDEEYEQYLKFNTHINSIKKINRERELNYYEILNFFTSSDTIQNEYFSVKHIKSEMNYHDDYEALNLQNRQEEVTVDSKQIAFTKAYSLLMGEKNLTEYENNYVIYHFGNGRSLFRLSSGEYKIKNYIKDYVFQKKGERVNLNNALALVTDLKVFSPYILSDGKIKTAKDESNDSRINNFCTVYSSVYVLPFNKYGSCMAKIMTEPMWKEDLLAWVFKDIQDTHTMSVQCDYYDELSKTYYLLFCIPDIARLRKFINAAEKETDKTKNYKILCFDYQTEFIKSVADGIVEIAMVKFEKYAKEHGLEWRAGF